MRKIFLDYSLLSKGPVCMLPVVFPYLGLLVKTCLRGFANNTSADQSGHLPRLINAFVIRFLESIISKLVSSEISIFWLVSVSEETGLNLTLSETPKTGFAATRTIHSFPSQHSNST